MTTENEIIKLTKCTEAKLLDPGSKKILPTKLSKFYKDILENLANLFPKLWHEKLCTAKVESRTQGSRPRPRTQKKSEAKDSLSEDRTSRSQGQECSRPRPRTKDTGASVLKKKRFSKISFRRSPIHRRTQNF